MKHSLISLCLLALVMLSCNKGDTDDSPCAEQRLKGLHVPNDKLTDTVGDYFHTYMDGTNRVFQWSDIAEQVCTKVHVKTKYSVMMSGSTGSIKARGNVDWQFLYEDTKELTYVAAENEFSGEQETGLKQAFSGLEGWFIPSVEVYFPTQGSFSADSVYLKERVSSVFFESTYRYYKE